MTGLETAGAIASVVTTAVAAVTLIVLIVYTGETHKLRLEAQRQTDVSVMPMLAVVNEEPLHDKERRVVLANVGSGPAFNLSIDPERWDNQELQVAHGNNILTPGQTRELRFRHQEGNSGTQLGVGDLYYWMNTQRIPDPLTLVVRCRSVNSVQYAFTFSCTPDTDGTGQLKITFEGQKPTAEKQ